MFEVPVKSLLQKKTKLLDLFCGFELDLKKTLDSLGFTNIIHTGQFISVIKIKLNASGRHPLGCAGCRSTQPCLINMLCAGRVPRYSVH